MIITGTLLKIDDWKRLIIEIDENIYAKLKPLGVHAWEYTPENETKHFYLRVNLDRFDKAVVLKKFNPLLKQLVVIKGSINNYDYTSIGKQIKGTNFLLEKINKATPKVATLDAL